MLKSVKHLSRQLTHSSEMWTIVFCSCMEYEMKFLGTEPPAV